MSGRRRPILARIKALAASAGTMSIACAPSTPDVQLVLLLSVDTLRADRLGPHGSLLGLTPHLDALGAESTVFEAAYAPTAQTLPSVTALLTGRYPQTFGVTGNLSPVPGNTDTIAQRVQAAGWSTAAVVSKWVLRGEMGPDTGFDHFDDTLPQLEAARPMPERVAPDTTQAALVALDRCLPEKASRCLLWVHYQDPHGPYTPPTALQAERMKIEANVPMQSANFHCSEVRSVAEASPTTRFVEGHRDIAFYRAGYDAEVMHLDSEIGKLLDRYRVPLEEPAPMDEEDREHLRALGYLPEDSPEAAHPSLRYLETGSP